MPAEIQAQMETATRDISKLTKIQKLAALLTLLGPDNAAQVLKGLEPREVEAVSAEMVQFTLISQEEQIQILAEFSDVAVQASTSVHAGIDYTRNTLELALGTFKASDIITKVAPSRTPVGAMQAITDMDARNIFNLIKQEQIQTLAFVLSYLPPEKAAQVFVLLKAEQRDQVIERLATLAPTPVEIMEKVGEVLTARLDVRQSRGMTQTGGVTNAANVLNAMDKAVGKTLLVSVEERNPELAQAIRKKMFTFEDMIGLSGSSIQRIMREIDMADLSVSLKKVSEPLKKLLLANISRRAAEAVQEEMAYMGPVKGKDIEAAQLRIIEVVRKLEAEGEIDLDEAKQSQYEMA